MTKRKKSPGDITDEIVLYLDGGNPQSTYDSIYDAGRRVGKKPHILMVSTPPPAQQAQTDGD
jgi:hypothetical protein